MPIPCYLVQSVAHASSFREKSCRRALVALARFLVFRLRDRCRSFDEALAECGIANKCKACARHRRTTYLGCTQWRMRGFSHHGSRGGVCFAFGLSCAGP